MLTIDRVSKQFGSFLAVNDISFDVRPAEILALVGRAAPARRRWVGSSRALKTNQPV